MIWAQEKWTDSLQCRLPCWPGSLCTPGSHRWAGPTPVMSVMPPPPACPQGAQNKASPAVQPCPPVPLLPLALLLWPHRCHPPSPRGSVPLPATLSVCSLRAHPTILTSLSVFLILICAPPALLQHHWVPKQPGPGTQEGLRYICPRESPAT